MLNTLRLLSLGFFFGLVVTVSVSWAQADKASTGLLSEAIGKEGAIWETFYKFTTFIEAGKPARLVYQDMDRFELHRDFLATRPQFRGMTRDQIDGLTYRAGNGRLAYTGVLVIHSGDDGIHNSRFSLAMEEAPSATLVAEIHALVRKSSEGDRLGNSFDFEVLPHQESVFQGQLESLKAAGIEVHSRGEAGDSVSYTEAWNVGTLEAVDNQEDLDAKVRAGRVGAATIIFAKEALREIPLVAGVISSVPLTPASHTVLLAQMYGIPVAYFKDAPAKFSGLSGKKIFLSARGGLGQAIEWRTAEYFPIASAADYKLLASLKSKPKVEVPFKPDEMEIRDVENLTQNDIGAHGGKSAQLGGIMRRLPRNSVNKAISIPLGYGLRFFKMGRASNGMILAEFIDQQLAKLDEASLRSPEKVEQVTKVIREEIKKAKFPADLLKKIEQKLKEKFPGPCVKVRFRSTGNAEDGKELNGAGLYDSTGVWLLCADKTDDIEKKLKKVLASLYNARAYTARRQFQIDEKRVGMGILIHPAFTDEVGNGVIRLTADKKREYFQYEIVTLKGDEEQVTHAGSVTFAEVVSGMGRIPFEVNERVIVQQPYQGHSRERTLFESKIYRELGGHMARLIPEYDVPGEIVDIESEFKIMKGADGKLMTNIKQVRRVPHPSVRAAADGSRYLVLGGEVDFAVSEFVNTSAIADLWLPKKFKISMPTFTEAQVRAGRITVGMVTFDIRGRAYTIKNPRVEAQVTDFGEYGGGYSLTVHLPNDIFPSLRLEISNSDQSLAVHSLASSGLRVQMSADPKNVGDSSEEALTADFLAGGGGGRSAEGRAGRILFRISNPHQQMTVEGEDTLFFGEGDGRSVRVGRAQVNGIWSRPLNVGREAIGYGANHHQGDESYVFDLFADPSLTAAERNQLGRTVGRYLYLVSAGYSEEGPIASLVKEDGKAKKLGSWKARELKPARKTKKSCAKDLRPQHG